MTGDSLAIVGNLVTTATQLLRPFGPPVIRITWLVNGTSHTDSHPKKMGTKRTGQSSGDLTGSTGRFTVPEVSLIPILWSEITASFHPTLTPPINQIPTITQMQSPIMPSVSFMNTIRQNLSLCMSLLLRLTGRCMQKKMILQNIKVVTKKVTQRFEQIVIRRCSSTVL